MSLVKIEIIFDSEIDGFSLADFTIYVNHTIFTTLGDPKLKLMIFISLSDLMTGISNMIKNPKRKNYSFLGISSSFILKFERKKDEIIIYDKKKSEKVHFIDFIKALELEMNRVFTIIEKLDIDSGLDDFILSYKDFIDNIKLLK